MLLAVANQRIPQNSLGPIYINESTTIGIDLAEYYLEKIGTYPPVDKEVRFIISEGVDVIAPSTAVAAITTGDNWPSGNTPIVENRGRILGRGGDGGRSAEWYQGVGIGVGEAPWGNPANLSTSENGTDGGTAVEGQMTIHNYGLISGGGGGGGGGGLAIFNAPSHLSPYGVYEVIGGSGSGGGAPYGPRSPNANTISSLYKYHAVQGTIPFDYTTEEQPLYLVQVHPDERHTRFYTWYGPAYPVITKEILFRDVNFKLTYPTFFLPQYHSGGVDYHLTSYVVESEAIDKTQPSVVHDGLRMYQQHSVTLRQSSDGDKLTGGKHGYGGMGSDGVGIDGELVMPGYFESLDVTTHHGGDGGDLGNNGQNAVNTDKTTLTKIKGMHNKVYQNVHTVPPANGGLAGFIKEGNVTIINHTGGITKGR